MEVLSKEERCKEWFLSHEVVVVVVVALTTTILVIKMLFLLYSYLPFPKDARSIFLTKLLLLLLVDICSKRSNGCPTYLKNED